MTSIVAGIIISTTAVCTAVWAVAGDRLARYLPDLTYRRVPTDAEVDALVAAAQRRRDAGVPDLDDLMPVPYGTRTYAEHYAAIDGLPPCVSDAEIADAPRYAPGLVDEQVNPDDLSRGTHTEQWVPRTPPLSGLRGWLAGSYAMPSDAEVDAAHPHTQRGRCRTAISKDHTFADELPGVAALPNPTGLVQGHATDARLLYDLNRIDRMFDARSST